ncbi:MAG: dTDP-4-dehydrorhamnose 3,5-epimerase/reductase [Actinomycetota bacterium]|jgi:dTDP-4-dehydrorhamnose 3,5-epimerase|nr:dTDP-4-dehydrorhamnose 3,5-epimerase/reductase [Actinomycetota bacterium]
MARHPQVLITGAGGQVGAALRPLLPEARFAAHRDLDVTNLEVVLDAERGVDAIVHLAAITHVDWCEQNSDEAYRVNAGGTANVVGAARQNGARVLYVSTDFVFAGDRDGEYSEEAPTGPLNVYGFTKLEGENHLDPGKGDLTIRSSWIFGDGHNFVRTILRLADEGPLRVLDDQRGRPTSAIELARAIVFLLDEGAAGTIHVAGDGEPATWAELAEVAVQAAGRDIPVTRIDTPTYVAEAERVIAPRPPNSALALDKARAMNVPLLDWRTSVTNYVEAIT